jgi:uncharacterized protein
MTFTTYTGREISDLMNPKPEDVCLEDIARHLSKEQRFGGASHQDFYSVAQHSVLVSRLVHPANALLGLFHDAAEAYIKDIPTPLKRALGKVYRDLECRWLLAIGGAIGISSQLAMLPMDVKVADSVSLATEFRDLFYDRRGQGLGVEPSPEKIEGQPPRVAYGNFMARWEELTGRAR